jgi:hypothetical protein
VIDRQDFDLVSQYTWYVDTTKGYLRAKINGKNVRLHRLILLTDLQVDHKDQNKLNNRRDNLRPATGQQNKCNIAAKGVYQVGNKWRATITRYGKCIHLGYFDTHDLAMIARNAKTIELDGEFACLN